jgi:3-keto-disaccharide hydrolase
MTISRTDLHAGPIRLSPPSRWPVVSGAVCMLISAMAAGQGAKDQPAGRAKTLVLFDGKSLDGWKKTDFYHAGDVKVEDGKIVMNAGGSMTGITSTRQDLPRTGYELGYEAMRLSGVDFFAAATFPVGKSFITLVNGGWGGHVTGLSSLNGMDASENETTRGYQYQDKTWYRFRVRVTDAVIRCWVNDKELIAVNYQDKQVGTRVEVRANEPLGFATWETGGAIRNIEIRLLTPAEIAAANQID